MPMKRMPMKNPIFISIVLAGLMALIGCATQSDMNTIDTRLTEMEMRDIQQRQHREQLKSEFETYSQELRKQSAGLRATLEELNEDIRMLSGRVEEMEHAFKQQQQNAADLESKRQEKLDSIAQSVEENSQRLNRMDQYLNLESSKQRVAVAAPVAPVSKPSSEDEIYRSAKEAFDQGDFEAARQQFQEFMKRYPDSKNADNAQFWIGEIYYREKWYEKAILEYQNVIEKYPKGNKAPAALLKQGLAFSNIGDAANAKLILQELGRKYPNSNEAKVAAEKLKTMK
ncbi:MAG: tol-pal system protein YbgF [Deltaproteobacteria bacterium]|nr:tol-pal system protein YbgF [Deltaproteobacteria bacterium]MBW2470000.1 tol-pal system protein YbgF [Deltaproteobacteria bacterium]MBW2489295.1 tol-pal system protein YbgF [Deltaproteobacteria bacterium]MBW2517243.1 tol-pal system protein YbgF [Deltaproteobacteria bacterium]